jgi:NAD(P)-dependent dehydrogenase (short-subunit alcohol dehydrogenase family)
MTDDLSGRCAVVTGAADGMGRAVALLLGMKGARVAVLDMNGAGAEAVAGEIRAAGGMAFAFTVDVSDSTQVAAALRDAEARLGPIDHLVNIAGMDSLKDVEHITDAEWDRMFAVTVNGAFYTTRAAMPGMMARKFGRIVNMSSLHAVRGQAGRSHYAAAKAAIMGFTKSLAREKAAYNIRVNAVAPGPIDTKLWRAGRSGPQLERDMEERSKIIPIGRLGQPEEVAAVMVFLLSAESSYITGQVVNIDGGEIMA